MKLPVAYPSLDSDDPRIIRRFIAQMFQRIAVAFNNPDFGVTGDRPASQLTVGQTYFDTTLGFPVWWDGVQWVDATGTPA